MTIVNFADMRWMAKGIALCGATLAFLTGAGSASAQISVSPVIVQMTAGAVAANRAIAVTNSGAAPASVRFYAGDFDQEEGGENLFAELGTNGNSCAGRIRVYPDGAALLPGETQSVRVEMEPGARSCWSTVFVETAAAAAGGTLVRQRIAVKVYGVRAAARVEGEVTRVATEGEGNGRKLVVTFRNLGEAPLRPEGTLEIRSFAGEVTAKVAIPGFSVLPGRDRTVEIPMPAVDAAGEYIAVPVLDFGGPYLAGGQVVFDVGPNEGGLAARARATGQRDDP